MNIAVTHKVSPNLNQCELTHMDREPIDIEQARAQHDGYNDCLARHGLKVIELDANKELPDSVFVEDTAVVVDEVAVMTPMGVDSRRPEVAAVAAEMANHRPVVHIDPSANLEGGDVVRINRSFYVGLSSRSDRAGVAGLAGYLEPHGYTVTGVELRAALHLKSAVSQLDESTLLINREMVDPALFTGRHSGFRLVDVPPDEPKSANILIVDGTVILPSAYARMVDLLLSMGLKVDALEMSELLKAESGVTCSSLIFRDMTGAA